MTKDIQSPHADLPSYQPPKPLAPSLPEGLARERKPPYDRDTGYHEEQKGETPPR
jgi:hypothetical protein